MIHATLLFKFSFKVFIVVSVLNETNLLQHQPL